MSRTLQWVGKHLSLGGLLRHTGGAAGTIAKYTVISVGATTEFVSGGSEVGRKIRQGCDKAGGALDTTLTATGKGLGYVADKAVEYTGKAVGEAAGGVAKIVGASEESVAVAKKVGNVVGAAAVGLAVGAGVADILVAAAAASGTAGAAATTSGLAALGGGSVAAGGGGIAAGQAVVQGIAAAGTASGIATNLAKDDS